MLCRCCAGLRCLLPVCALLSGCAGPVPAGTSQSELAACYVIIDAGSSGTRLNIIRREAGGWVRHAGPTTVPLADPARGIRGKSMRDAETVTNDIVALLKAMTHAGPVDSRGAAKWPAFDWRRRCDVRELAVYATAGMRLAERQHPRAAAELWEMLKRKLGGVTRAPIRARTLSGFEEGLYAWLAVRAEYGGEAFGNVDMGGASVQVTFPCSRCRGAVAVRIGRRVVRVFSHSFLGLGQDEAWEKFGSTREACRRGAGRLYPGWEGAMCTRGIVLTDGHTHAADIPLDRSEARRWFLGGALRHLRSSDVRRYCLDGSSTGFEPERACFRTLYQLYFLRALGVPTDAARVDDDWTVGAAICSADHCLVRKP